MIVALCGLAAAGTVMLLTYDNISIKIAVEAAHTLLALCLLLYRWPLLVLTAMLLTVLRLLL
jgi:hypothetical protein